MSKGSYRIPISMLALAGALGGCAAVPAANEGNRWEERDGFNYVLPGTMGTVADPDNLIIGFVPIFPEGYRAPGVTHHDAPRMYAAAWIPRPLPEGKSRPFSAFQMAVRRGEATIYGRPILYAVTDEVREMLLYDEGFRRFVAQYLSVEAVMQSRFRVTDGELKTNRYDARLRDWLWRQAAPATK